MSLRADIRDALVRELARTTAPLTPTTHITRGSIDGHVLLLEIAADPESRARGLDHGTRSPRHDGMLFIFPEKQVVEFWTKRTRVPVSIAFLADNGRIVGLDYMQALDETLHASPRPVRLAVEVPGPWFTSRGVRVGDTFRFGP